jgi:UDP-3-O-[3-hydroxymyristoyl] glucosamine N-acyltransferase
MMNNNLLIIGAGVYGVVAMEIAESMNCFEKIAFVDDERKETPNGIEVIGNCSDIKNLVEEYSNIIVAIGNPEVRLSLLQKLEEEHPCRVVKLISPKAYVAPSAQVMQGCIVEPMAVIQSMSLIAKGCIISAGAVVNHASMCCDGVHVDCNATVAGATLVPAGTKIKSGEVFDRKDIGENDLFFNPEEWAKRLSAINTPIEKRTPVPVNGKLYSFDDVM